MLATATYLTSEDGNLLMLILHPILQPCQLILQNLHQWPHLQLTDVKVHCSKPLPHHLNLPQRVVVTLQLLDHLDKPVDCVPVLLDHVLKGHGFMGLEGSLPLHLRHLQLHPTDVFNMLHRVLANAVHHVAHHLEVIQDLLKESRPLLLSGSLRNQLQCCQLLIKLNHVDIPPTPWP